MTTSTGESGGARDTADVAVIGAGPAGLETAIAAADAGLRVCVLDLGARIGGQYYRHATEMADATAESPFHHGWPAFVDLRGRFSSHVAHGRITHRAEHAVWSIVRDADFLIRGTEGERDRRPYVTRARSVVIATGAIDRHVPFPGWTLPGVMAAGGAQSLLKGSGVAPGQRAVVAGTGPFLLPVADGLLTAGAEVAEVVEANPPWRLAVYPRALPVGVGKLGEVAGYAVRLRRRGVTVRTRRAVTAAHGVDRLEAVTTSRIDEDWRPIRGTERRVACDLLAVGYGFRPQIELALELGCAATNTDDGSVAIAVDDSGRSSVAGVYAAGETTGVGGSDLARVEGRLCGAAVARDLGMLRRPQSRFQVGSRRLRRAFADALAETFPVRPGWSQWLGDETIVCRCEEVPYRCVREAVTRLGADDARAVKLLVRPGMGWCQGRICAGPVAELTAELAGRAVSCEELVAMTRCSLAQPVSLDVLADLDLLEEPMDARGADDRRMSVRWQLTPTDRSSE